MKEPIKGVQEIRFLKADKRGRITIPADIRKKLGFKPGDKLRALLLADGSIEVEKIK